MSKQKRSLVWFIPFFLAYIFFTSWGFACITRSFGMNRGINADKLNNLFCFGIFVNLFFQTAFIEIFYHIFNLASAGQKTNGMKRLFLGVKILWFAIAVFITFRHSLYSISGIDNDLLRMIFLSFSFLVACDRIASHVEKFVETLCKERNAYIIAFRNDNKEKSFHDAIKCWKHKKKHDKNMIYEKDDLKVLYK
jgi:hypothetical protein